jgi:hypothetical protein
VWSGCSRVSASRQASCRVTFVQTATDSLASSPTQAHGRLRLRDCGPFHLRSCKPAPRPPKIEFRCRHRSAARGRSGRQPQNRGSLSVGPTTIWLTATVEQNGGARLILCSKTSSRPMSQSAKMTKHCESSIRTPLSEKWLIPNPRLSS